MGSSIGNLDRTEAVDFLKAISELLQGHDSMLIGIDACQESDKVYHAYNDKRGLTHEFILNGLMHANNLMGKDVFRKDEWKVVGEYDEVAGRHQAFYSPVRDVVVEETLIRAGEKIRVEESYKYSLLQSNELWQRAGLTEQARFANRINEYRKLDSLSVLSCILSSTYPICYPIYNVRYIDRLAKHTWANDGIMGSRPGLHDSIILCYPPKLDNLEILGNNRQIIILLI